MIPRPTLVWLVANTAGAGERKPRLNGRRTSKRALRDWLGRNAPHVLEQYKENKNASN